MESTEEDIKPKIPTDDIPDDESLLTLAPAVTKFKQSRYEDVWPKDVHAAFMEAVALYPPMGKRRQKYYRGSKHENQHLSDANQARSFGRCQLIQSYILEKTGKNRSRKQVSSHLQRLKKIHKDNPAMRPLFSERFHRPSEHCSGNQDEVTRSQDIPANNPSSTRCLKSEPDLTDTFNLQTRTETTNSSSHTSETSSSNTASCNAIGDLSTDILHQSSCFNSQDFPSPPQCSASTLFPLDSDYLPEFQDPGSSMFKDISGRFRAGSSFGASTFSISMRRLASRRSIQNRQADFRPAAHFSRILHSPGLQQTHQWISHASTSPIDDLNLSCNYPLDPPQQVFQVHTPFYPLQSTLFDKQRLDAGLVTDCMWSQNPEMSLGPREETFGGPRPRYHPATYSYTSAYPDVSFGPYGYPAASELLMPRGVSYPYTFTGPPTIEESSLNVPRHVVSMAEHLTPTLLIRPTPIYPLSYTHSDGPTAAPSLP